MVGETVNLASRLQAEAPVDEVLISGDTHRHERGGFSFRPLGMLSLKGVGGPVEGHVVIRSGPSGSSSTKGGASRAWTPGPSGDLELLKIQQTFEDVVDEGSPQVVTIVGDAGVGKSRLLRELDRWLAEIPEPLWWFRGRASPSTQNLPNALLREMMAARLDIHESDDPELGPGQVGGRNGGSTGRRIRGPCPPRRPLARIRRGRERLMSAVSATTLRVCTTVPAPTSPTTSPTSPTNRPSSCCSRTSTGLTRARSAGSRRLAIASGRTPYSWWRQPDRRSSSVTPSGARPASSTADPTRLALRRQSRQLLGEILQKAEPRPRSAGRTRRRCNRRQSLLHRGTGQVDARGRRHREGLRPLDRPRAEGRSLGSPPPCAASFKPGSTRWHPTSARPCSRLP